MQQLAQGQVSEQSQQPSFQGNQSLMPNMQSACTPQQLMAMQNALYGGGMTNLMDQDFMAMTSGINKLNMMA